MSLGVLQSKQTNKQTNKQKLSYCVQGEDHSEDSHYQNSPDVIPLNGLKASPN